MASLSSLCNCGLQSSFCNRVFANCCNRVFAIKFLQIDFLQSSFCNQVFAIKFCKLSFCNRFFASQVFASQVFAIKCLQSIASFCNLASFRKLSFFTIEFLQIKFCNQAGVCNQLQVFAIKFSQIEFFCNRVFANQVLQSSVFAIKFSQIEFFAIKFLQSSFCNQLSFLTKKLVHG